MDDLDILIEGPKTIGTYGPTILDLCAGSGSWSQPYADRNYRILRVTLPDYDTCLWPSAPSNMGRLPNDFGDIREFIGHIHGILAAPPCTCFSAAGARIRRTDKDMRQAISVMDACIRLVHVLKPKWWALENPIGKMQRWLGEPTYRFQPNWFGDPYTKQTLLWGRFEIPKENFVAALDGSKMSDNIRSQANRSITPPAFAEAFCIVNP